MRSRVLTADGTAPGTAPGGTRRHLRRGGPPALSARLPACTSGLALGQAAGTRVICAILPMSHPRPGRWSLEAEPGVLHGRLGSWDKDGLVQAWRPRPHPRCQGASAHMHFRDTTRTRGGLCAPGWMESCHQAHTPRGLPSFGRRELLGRRGVTYVRGIVTEFMPCVIAAHHSSGVCWPWS